MQSPSIDNDHDEELFVKPEPVESNPDMDIPDSTKDNANSTPQKRQQNKPERQPDDDDPPIKKRKRSGSLSPYPATYESDSEDGDSEDDNEKLLRMEEVEGKSWTEIQKAIREITGKQFSGSLLVAQYLRMKEDMVLFEVEKSDEPILIQCKKDIEKRFELEKWQKISDAIASRSGKKYPARACENKFDEIVERECDDCLLCDNCILLGK